MNKYVYTFISVWFSINSFGQFVTSGTTSISVRTDVSIYEDVYVLNTSVLENNGDLFLFKNVTNNGVINFDELNARSTLYMVGDTPQSIEGTGSTTVQQIEFDNASDDFAFLLEKEIVVKGTSYFDDGIIGEGTNGLMTFDSESGYHNVSNRSYLNNKARKIGAEEFTFPIGDFHEGTYVVRPAGILIPSLNYSSFLASFHWLEPGFVFDHEKKEQGIGLIDLNEYWQITNELSEELVTLTLTYNETTTPAFIYNNPDKMIIVRWNGFEWVNEGGEVNIQRKSITANVSGYGVFTLANRSDGDGVDNNIDFDSSNSFSPNGDGINDEFVIPDLAENYPNFKMTIFNRYGNKIYDYSNNGSTTPKWWDGRSYGSRTMNGNTETVPSSTYWYVVDFNDGVTKPYQGWVYLNK